MEVGLADVWHKYRLRLLSQGLPPHHPVLRAVLCGGASCPARPALDKVPARLTLLWFICQCEEQLTRGAGWRRGGALRDQALLMLARERIDPLRPTEPRVSHVQSGKPRSPAVGDHQAFARC